MVIAVALVATACVVGSQYFPRSWGAEPLPYVLTALVFVPFAVRRSAPIPVLLTSTAALASYLAAGYDQLALNFWGPLLALYTVASLRPVRVTAACAAVVVPVTFWATMAAGLALPVGIAETLLMPAMAWVFGDTGRRLAERNGQLATVTAQLRTEQRERTARAVNTERVRIARELHDVVAHHMSVIAMQAGVADYVLEADPVAARTALNTVATTSREALDELRHVLDLLRISDTEGSYEPEPAPRLGRLHVLIDRVKAAGIEIEMETTGQARTLPSGLQLNVYRVVQEALTNVLKHGGPCRAKVVVTWHPRELSVRITNDGHPAVTGQTPGSGGHGLIGMRERARLYGGTLTADARPEGGFTVELTVPTPDPVPSHDR
jgi:signal transduction histidine kinase